MRFDDEYYLKDWRNQNQFPKIHDSIWKVIEARSTGSSYIDLCGNHGMLAQRVIEVLGKPCILVDLDQKTLDLSQKYGTTSPKYQMRINKAHYPALQALLQQHSVDTMIARRCISELFTSPTDPDRIVWAGMLAECGIRQVFLQGRMVSSRSTHPLKSVNEEIECFLSHYKLVWQEKQCAYLELK